MRDLTTRLKRLEQQIIGNENEQIIITLGDDVLTFKNSNELIDAWLASFDDDECP